MKKTFTELIKEAFRNKKKLTLQELYQYVIEHKEELEKFPFDHQHGVRATVYALKNKGMIKRVGGSEYEYVGD
jgi:hypothetical protein